ncbi:metal cation symporter ZIP14-like [Rhinoraja longicauda]
MQRRRRRFDPDYGCCTARSLMYLGQAFPGVGRCRGLGACRALLLVMLWAVGAEGAEGGQKNSTVPTPAAFLQDLLSHYGEHQVLALNQLKALLNRLDVGVGSTGARAGTGNRSLAKCMSSAEIFAVHQLSNSSLIDGAALTHICPTILQQLESGACNADNQEDVEDEGTDDGQKPTITEVWGLGFVSVSVVNLSSLLGVSVTLCRRKPFFRRIFVYFIALAIGTLTATAILQLIPEVRHAGNVGPAGPRVVRCPASQPLGAGVSGAAPHSSKNQGSLRQFGGGHCPLVAARPGSWFQGNVQLKPTAQPCCLSTL